MRLNGWQRIGIALSILWAEMSKPKKGFVIFCSLFLGASLLFGAMVVMNLYVDNEVPVALLSVVT
jgi:hypothetical protein